jgi:hypothetical protein
MGSANSRSHVLMRQQNERHFACDFGSLDPTWAILDPHVYNIRRFYINTTDESRKACHRCAREE